MGREEKGRVATGVEGGQKRARGVWSKYIVYNMHGKITMYS